MCRDWKCEVRKNCYRYTRLPRWAQSYFENSPDRGDGCRYFVDRTGRKDTIAVSKADERNRKK